MAQQIAEAVIKLELENKELRAKLGEAMTDFEKFKSKGQKASEFLSASWLKLTAVAVAVGMAIQKVTRYDDETTKSVMAEMITLGMHYTDVLKTMPAVMNLASARQMDLATAGMILTRAYNGKTQIIRRNGIFI